MAWWGILGGGWWGRPRQLQRELRQEMLARHGVLTDLARQFAASGLLAIPDGFPLRFELLVVLVARQMADWRRQGEVVKAEALWGVAIEGFDISLRERGVSDLRMASRMRTLLRHGAGRLGVYLAAMEEENPATLAAAVARNVLNGAPPEDPQIQSVLDWLAQVRKD